MRSQALALYKAPFRFKHGYVFDANGEMVSDDGDIADSVARVRGWGRIGYMVDAKQLQDEVGTIIAEALTEFWIKHRSEAKPDWAKTSSYPGLDLS